MSSQMTSLVEAWHRRTNDGVKSSVSLPHFLFIPSLVIPQPHPDSLQCCASIVSTSAEPLQRRAIATVVPQPCRVSAEIELRRRGHCDRSWLTTAFEYLYCARQIGDRSKIRRPYPSKLCDFVSTTVKASPIQDTKSRLHTGKSRSS
ncbi:hypothetical protein BU16DRAFT_303201 [Lophium mytilinum]|uniref:Uncharacterized protein n=1 Tax=Lophium mytilinum TaxID=390894 RepID=A0A6A6R4M3_9PEZI|nr:hypothetical protein BU16DRAFT_303201 [Lophium mytilinum]